MNDGIILPLDQKFLFFGETTFIGIIRDLFYLFGWSSLVDLKKTTLSGGASGWF